MFRKNIFITIILSNFFLTQTAFSIESKVILDEMNPRTQRIDQKIDDDEIIDLTQKSKENVEHKEKMEIQTKNKNVLGYTLISLGTGALVGGTILAINGMAGSCKVKNMQGDCVSRTVDSGAIAIGSGLGIIGGAVLSLGIMELIGVHPESEQNKTATSGQASIKSKIKFNSVNVTYNENSKDFSGGLKWIF